MCVTLLIHKLHMLWVCRALLLSSLDISWHDIYMSQLMQMHATLNYAQVIHVMGLLSNLLPSLDTVLHEIRVKHILNMSTCRSWCRCMPHSMVHKLHMLWVCGEKFCPPWTQCCMENELNTYQTRVRFLINHFIYMTQCLTLRCQNFTYHVPHTPKIHKKM